MVTHTLDAALLDVLKSQARDERELAVLVAGFVVRPATGAATPPLSRVLEDQERAILVTTLALCQGKVAVAARRLGVKRTTLMAKVEKFGIEHRRRRKTAWA